MRSDVNICRTVSGTTSQMIRSFFIPEIISRTVAYPLDNQSLPVIIDYESILLYYLLQSKGVNPSSELFGRVKRNENEVRDMSSAWAIVFLAAFWAMEGAFLYDQARPGSRWAEAITLGGLVAVVGLAFWFLRHSEIQGLWVAAFAVSLALLVLVTELQRAHGVTRNWRWIHMAVVLSATVSLWFLFHPVSNFATAVVTTASFGLYESLTVWYMSATSGKVRGHLMYVMVMTVFVLGFGLVAILQNATL